MPFVRFLELEGDGDCVGESDVFVGDSADPSFSVKSKVFETEDLCAALLFGEIGCKILTGAHRKEEGSCY